MGSMLILKGLGACLPEKILKNRCSEIEFQGHGHVCKVIYQVTACQTMARTCMLIIKTVAYKNRAKGIQLV